jgi:N-methylhydantoinase B/oxoprolinase/acetone carboxylase alpha subunit
MSDRKVPASPASADPVLVEIIRNGVIAVTEEMKVNLMRTAYNMIIYEALDFTVGLFTREGETVSIGLGLPMFIRGMSETVKAKIRHFGADGFAPGDILLTNDAYITGIGPLGGGWGAKRGEDGVSATVCINDGDTHNSPNEQLEAKYPVLVESLSLIPDSGGPGRYRGGLGVETVVQAIADFNVNTSIERAVCLPWGLEGGLEGTGNEMLMRRDGVAHDDVPNAKVFRARVKAGDAFILRSGGGGGFGSPLVRPAASVQHDVRQGYVSIEAARDYYGVVLDRETLAVDTAATETQRALLVEVHRRRVAEQGDPPRRIARKTLDTMPPGHLPIRCLLPSCCGRWHPPRDPEATEVEP